jgi:hypothetical protein
MQPTSLPDAFAVNHPGPSQLTASSLLVATSAHSGGWLEVRLVPSEPARPSIASRQIRQLQAPGSP